MIDDSVYEDGIIKAKKSRKLKKKMTVFTISLFAIIIIIISVFLINKTYKEKNTISYENYDLYQYFAGTKYNYNGTISIEHNNGITNVKSTDLDIEIDNTPIYYQNIDNEVLFPESMELIFPNIKTQNYRLNYFSKIMVDITDNVETAFYLNNDAKKHLDKCFLYDGDNLYFFPYTVSVTIDDKIYHLSPLSYIKVEYNGEIELYNKKEDKYLVIDSYKNDVVATLFNYKINLSTDMIMYSKEDNRILVKNVNRLNLYDNAESK